MIIDKAANLPATHPDVWFRQEAMDSQRCGFCNANMQSTQITNVRGGWEHYDCLREIWLAHRRPEPIYQGKQNELREIINSGVRVHCWFDRTVKQTDGRYFWQVIA